MATIRLDGEGGTPQALVPHPEVLRFAGLLRQEVGDDAMVGDADPLDAVYDALSRALARYMDGEMP